MNCQQVRALKETYVDGGLPEAQCQELEAHLTRCIHCAARVVLARRIQQELGPTVHQAIGEPQLSPAAEARIRARLWGSAQPARRQPAWLWWVTWGAAPALVLAVTIVLALVIWPLLTPQLPDSLRAFITPPAQETSAPSVVVVVLPPSGSAQPTTVGAPAPTASPRAVPPTSTAKPLASPVAPVATRPATVAPTSPPPAPSASVQPTPTTVPTTPSAVIASAPTPTVGTDVASPGTWARYLEGESVTCLVRRGPEVWAGTSAGQVIRLNTTNGESTRFALRPDLPAGVAVTALTVDRSGRVWAATAGQGVFALDMANGTGAAVWQAYTAASSGLPSDEVRALVVDAAGTLWCGTDLAVNRLVLKGTGTLTGTGPLTGTAVSDTWQSFAVPIGTGGPTAHQVTALAAEGPDTLWVGLRGNYRTEIGAYAGGGLYRLRTGDVPRWEKALGEEVGLVQAIFVGADGRKWVATSPAGAPGSADTHGGGVVVWSGTEWRLFEALGAGMPSRAVLSVAVDARRRTWIGTDRGLVVYEGTRRTVYHKSDSGLLSDRVVAVVPDEVGGVWLATDAALCHLTEP